jgi:hypothetical protein
MVHCLRRLKGVRQGALTPIVLFHKPYHAYKPSYPAAPYKKGAGPRPMTFLFGQTFTTGEGDHPASYALDSKTRRGKSKKKIEAPPVRAPLPPLH